MLTCMLCMFLPTACEKSSVRSSSTVVSNEAIDARSDCDRCPEDDECCCAIELEFPDTEYADLRICGSSNWTDLCSGGAVSPCPAFSNGGHDEYLDELNPKLDLCMFEGNPFWVYNKDASLSVNLLITCQGDEILPQILQITIPPLGRVYFGVDGFCVVSECE